MNIAAPPTKHTCYMGGAEVYPLDTLIKCSVCEKWWFNTEVYCGFGFNTEWRRVRLYHFGKRKRINNG